MRGYDFRAALKQCVLCGKCKADCPTYALERIERLSARGRVALVGGLLEGELKPSRLMRGSLDSCLLCGMCEASCPAGVRVTEAVYEGRRMLAPGGGLRRAALAAALKAGLSFPPRVADRLMLALWPVARPLLGLPPFRIPRAAGRRSGTHPKIKRRSGAVRGRVAVFAGCAANRFAPSLMSALEGALLGAGYDVVVPAGEACCGSPLRALGLEDEARKLARRNAALYAALDADAVVSPCPTCTLMLKHYYIESLGLEMPRPCDPMGLGLAPGPGRPLEGRAVIYHDPCHLRFGLGVAGEPRRVLEAMGARLVEPEAKGCCGLGALLTDGARSARMAEGLRDSYARAEVVVTACPGCVMQIGRVHPDVRHVLDVMAEAR